MIRSMTSADRRALADALRHMHHAGVRRIDLKQASRLTHRNIHQAINTVIIPLALATANRLPGRDGINGPLTVDVVSPRHVSSSRVPGDDLLPVDWAGGALGVPVIFQGASVAVGNDGVAQGSAGLVGGKSLGHADQMSRQGALCHGAAAEGTAP